MVLEGSVEYFFSYEKKIIQLFSRTLSCRYVHGFELFGRTFNTGLEDILMIFYKGETGKQALKLICLQFLTNYIEILSISLFLRGRLNRAIRSEECL